MLTMLIWMMLIELHCRPILIIDYYDNSLLMFWQCWQCCWYRWWWSSCIAAHWARHMCSCHGLAHPLIVSLRWSLWWRRWLWWWSIYSLIVLDHTHKMQLHTKWLFHCNELDWSWKCITATAPISIYGKVKRTVEWRFYFSKMNIFWRRHRHPLWQLGVNNTGGWNKWENCKKLKTRPNILCVTHLMLGI